MEFENLTFINQYEEEKQINKGILTVILKKDDKSFVRLKNRFSNTGKNELRINSFKNSGTWSSQRNKYKNGNKFKWFYLSGYYTYYLEANCCLRNVE